MENERASIPNVRILDPILQEMAYNVVTSTFDKSLTDWMQTTVQQSGPRKAMILLIEEVDKSTPDSPLSTDQEFCERLFNALLHMHRRQAMLN